MPEVARKELVGRARVFGDDVNTDYIISSTRKRGSIDASVLTQWLMEGVDPRFAMTVRPDDVIVAGRNFGCGSAMEVAVTVILAAGIRAVIAASFSRTFYRNAINNGLIPVVADTSTVREGDAVAIAMEPAGPTVRNLTSGAVIVAVPLTGIALEILTAGGLVAYIRSAGSLRKSRPPAYPSTTRDS
jgi:3-isopropylmalate/(R)-2-methylmalate dehydratase small subunit